MDSIRIDMGRNAQSVTPEVVPEPAVTAPPCPACGAALPPDAPGRLCPRCLLKTALNPELDVPAPAPDGAPTSFGPYVLQEMIARGGMGIVYKARDTRTGRRVALKMLAEEERASERDIQRFREEAEKAASLEHPDVPNIVPIYEMGEHDGRHYFTMPLLEGTLAERLDAYREPSRAARLMVTVARAVHHGHQHGLIHRDLKPANILLDAAGQPYVADFGVALAFEGELKRPTLTRFGALVGTLGYMAPEQARGKSASLTTAADVYSLGAILYELLTGRPPFVGDDLPELLRQLTETDPQRPSALVPVDRDLETLCLKCLEREPARRYASAEELAQELERYLRGEPIFARPLGLAARAWRWCRRHPLRAFLLAVAPWFLLCLTAGAILSAREQEQQRRRDLLAANVSAARDLAGTVLLEVTQYGYAVQDAAADPRLLEQFERGGAPATTPFCREMFEFYEDPRNGLKRRNAGRVFDDWFVFDTEGTLHGLWPTPPRPFAGLQFAWRDYFVGAKKLAERGEKGVYVSRILQAEVDGRHKLAFSAPIYDGGGKWVGVLVATVAADERLGSLALRHADDARRTIVLLGRTDNERHQAGAPPPEALTILVHDGLARGNARLLPEPAGRQLREALEKQLATGRAQLALPDFEGQPIEAAMLGDAYRDPVVGYEGRWIAGFAPVGNTGLVVVVQTRNDAVSEPNATLARRLALLGGLPFAIGAGLAVAVLLYARRREAAG